MNTTPNTPDATLPTDAAQAQEALKAALSTADEGAKQSVQHLGLIQQARVSQLSRTAAALKVRYGAKDPQVKAAEEAVVAGTAAAARTAMVHQQLATPEPAVATNGWALQGRVFDSAMKPLPNLTVFLVDRQKAYFSRAGFTYTDATGYFLLSYDGSDGPETNGPAKSATGTKGPGGAAGQGAAGGQGGATSTGGAASLPELFLEVANEEEDPIYLGKSALQPAVGSVTYQNIILPVGEPVIGDPPESIRGSAFPTEGKP